MNSQVLNDKRINSLINSYVFDPENPENNFDLGFHYESIGQTASAVSYYLRCAERTNDSLFQYECLIRASMCFEKQGTRNFTVKGLLQRAISICPNRPEAYYLLSRFYETEDRDGHWNYSFFIASIGEKTADFNSAPLRTEIDYPGRYAILYQKALAAWWCGLCHDAREIFNDLIENYDLDENHKNKVLSHLEKFNETWKGLHSVYDKKKINKLDGFPSVHFCSLVESTERRDNIIEQFSEHDIYPIPHIFNKISKIENEEETEYLNRKNYASTLSHLQMCYDWYHNTDEPYAIFCEDDVSLETIKYWNFTWREFFDSLPDYWDCIQLSLLSENPQRLETVRFRPRLFHDWGCQIYLIKREYVKKVLDTHNYKHQTGEFDFIVHGKTFLNPCAEHILFDTGGIVYNFPLFVEEISKFNTTFSRKENYCGKNSHDMITTWWKNNGLTSKLTDLMKKEYKVVDFCSFYGPYGSEMLLLRYHILKGYVDEFVVSESSYSHTGIPVKFECKNKIKEWGLPEEKFKVIEMQTPSDDELVIEYLDELNCIDCRTGESQSDIKSKYARVRDRLSKDALMKVLDDYDDETVFIHGDIDEIINPSFIPNAAYFARSFRDSYFLLPLVYLEGRADLQVYNKHYDCPQSWDWASFICSKSVLQRATPTQIRSHKLIPEEIKYMELINYWNSQKWTDIGWHFSWMGGKESRLTKKKSWEHRYDSFAWLVTSKYDDLDEYLEKDYEEGDIPPCGDINFVLKKYPKEKLPSEIFELPIVENFLFPKNVNTQNSQQEINKFAISKTAKQTSWIVDNFYENPDEIRDFALNQEYLEGGIGRGFIGRRTHQQFLFPGLKEKFEQIIGEKITKWEEHGMNGRFQIAWSGEPLVYHCDNQRWGGMLYLTPGAPYQCGTTLYAHKQTRARTYFDEGWDAAWTNVPGDSHLDGTHFEPVDVLGNVYNRLVIFDASCIHSASQYFGTVRENARLWQMFFFDT